MMNSDADIDRQDLASHPGTALRHRLAADVAALVLSLATGMPLRSARTLLPDHDEGATPYLGI